MGLTKTNILIVIGLIILSIIIPMVSADTITSDADSIINFLNNSKGIPIQVTTTSTTNWNQYLVSIIISSIFVLFFFGQMIGGGIDNTLIKVTLKQIKKHTGRHVVFMKHTQGSLFNQSMIDQKTASQLAEAMGKFQGKDFDIIFHTPGGEVFSSLMISRMLKQYPGKIRSIIPSMCMSGGTLLALSTDELIMNKTACMGPTDVQLGSLFKSGSAESWRKIVKFKGKRAEDSSISFALEGNKYTKTMREHLMNTIDFGLTDKQKKVLIDFITNGGVEHAYALTPDKLQEFGIPVRIMQNYKLINKLIKLSSKVAGEGITYV